MNRNSFPRTPNRCSNVSPGALVFSAAGGVIRRGSRYPALSFLQKFRGGFGGGGGRTRLEMHDERVGVFATLTVS